MNATAPATTLQVQPERAATEIAPEVVAVVVADAADEVAAEAEDGAATSRVTLEVVATAGVVEVLAGALELL